LKNNFMPNSAKRAYDKQQAKKKKKKKPRLAK